MREPILGILTLALGLGACSNGSTTTVQHQYAFSTLGELEDAIAAAPPPDTDSDSIPDSVELQLGTDPNDRDTDRDGLVDNYELFGSTFNRSDPLPDADNDGVIAPIDADDDGDGINDGEVVDTDNDSIPNYLEFYGFTYDFLTGQFRPWNGDKSVEHWVTDPLQFSTDQDAYSDAVEASGNLLDPSVVPPGDDPLVPAYPNITFELNGYAVTLNEEIQISEGESLEKGRSWNRQMESSHSYTKEQAWQVGGSFEISAKDGPKGTVSANYGETYSNTNTTSTSVAVGESVTSGENWSVARSSNPSDAARIKLFVKVKNRGTAPISNLVPTLALRIGGLNVATFRPANAKVNILVPGATYPEEAGVYWVVDTTENGPLSLTMTELRALERGAPVSVSATQIEGDVMRLSAEGTWERTGDTNEFVARCDAVCANIRIEVGDGEFVHHLVYADDTPSAPVTTLGDALARIGVDENGTLEYLDRDGIPQSVSLEGYTFAFDDDTLRGNGWELEGDGAPETKAPDDYTVDSTLIFPETTVMIRVPRDPQTEPGPFIHFAFLDTLNGQVEVSAADYQGIDSVVVTNEDGSVSLDLVEEIPGAGFYSGSVSGKADSSDLLRVVVTNLPGDSAEAELGQLFVDPGPQPPVISVVSLDLANHRVYANVSSGRPEDPFSAVTWVRAYHPALSGGFLELDRVANYYEDPDGYDAVFPSNVSSTNLKIVAFVSDGLFAQRVVTDAEVHDALVVDATLRGDVNFFREDTRRDSMDVDTGSVFTLKDTVTSTGDLFVQPDYFYSIGEYTKLGPGVDFNQLGRADIVAAGPSKTGYLKLGDNAELAEGDVLAFRTPIGAYAKLRINSSTTSYFLVGDAESSVISLTCVTFSGPEANAGGSQNVVFDATQTKILLKGGASVGAQSYKWSFTRLPAGSTATIDDSTLATASFVPDIGVEYDAELDEYVAARYGVRLVINQGTADESRDDVNVYVRFPEADAGDSLSVSYDPDVDDPIVLDGSGSIGAANYEWTFVSRPSGSTASISNRTTATANFPPDVEGEYVVRLTINKGRSDESTDDVNVDVTLID